MVKIDNIPVKMIIASGASVNALDRNTYPRLRQDSHQCTLSKSATAIYTYGSNTAIPVQGTFDGCLEFNNSKTVSNIMVADSDDRGPLLGPHRPSDSGC